MKIKTRQICFIMAAYTAATKLLLYPTYLSFISGRDLLFSALIDFVIQGVIVWCVAYLCSRTNKTFFELMQGAIGTIAAKVIMGLFALFFILFTILPLMEQKLYVHAIFYDTVPVLFLFLPFFFFAVFAASKSFTNIGRCADVCFPIFIFCAVVIGVMAAQDINFENLLPVLKSPPKKIFGGALATFFRFLEPAYMLMFLGRFDYKKGDAAKITVSYFSGAAVVLLFLFAFYGTYGGIASSRQFAISKISLFFPAIDQIGRVDLVVLYVLETVMLFALVLNIQLAVYCLSECFNYKNLNVLSLAVNGVLVVLTFALNNRFGGLHEVYSKWLWIVALVFSTVIPVLAWAAKALNRGKQNG